MGDIRLLTNQSINSSETFAGLEYSATWQVSGIVSTVQGDICKVAANDLFFQTGITIGCEDPWSLGLWAEEIRCQSDTNANNVANIQVVFRKRFPESTYEFSTFVQEEETCVDANNNLMEVVYKNDKQKITERKKVAYNGLKITKQLAILPDRSFVGCVNSNVWMGSGPGTWFCVGISASTSNGFNYQVGYDFIQNLNGFEITGFYLDKRTGRLPKDAENYPNAVKKFYLYQEAVFPSL